MRASDLAAALGSTPVLKYFSSNRRPFNHDVFSFLFSMCYLTTLALLMKGVLLEALISLCIL